MFENPPNRFHKGFIHGFVIVFKVYPTANAVNRLFPLSGEGVDDGATLFIVAGHSDLAGRVTILLVGIPACWIVGVGMFAVTLANGGVGAFGPIFGLVIFVIAIAMLVFFVMYLFLLFRLGAELRK